MDEWSRLRVVIAGTADVLNNNATRIRELLASGAEEPAPLKEALRAIEQAIADLESADSSGLNDDERRIWR